VHVYYIFEKDVMGSLILLIRRLHVSTHSL